METRLLGLDDAILVENRLLGLDDAILVETRLLGLRALFVSGCWVDSLGLLRREELREETGLVFVPVGPSDNPLNGVTLVRLSVGVKVDEVAEVVLSSFLASKLDWPSLVGAVVAGLVSKDEVSTGDESVVFCWEVWLVRSVDFRLLPSLRAVRLDRLDPPVNLPVRDEEEVSPVRRGDAVLSRGLVSERAGLSLLVIVGGICKKWGAGGSGRAG